MILSVSVHPAMAQMEAKDTIDKTNAVIDQIQADTACPGCAAGMSPERAEQYLNRTNISIKIRQVDLDGGLTSPTVANARTIRVSAGTLEVQPQRSDSVSSGSTEARSAAIIAEFDNDTAVKSYIGNVTMLMGYGTRTDVQVQRYVADLHGANITQNSTGLFEVVTYTYTNTTTLHRFKFAATQNIDANGKGVPPKVVIPGHDFPPLVQGKNDDSECWYWYLLIGIAVVAVIAAIATTIVMLVAGGASIKGVGGNINEYRNAMRDMVDRPHKSITAFYPEGTPLPSEGWMQSFGSGKAEFMLLFTLLVILIILGIAFPLVTLALTFLLVSIIGLLVCKGLVATENERLKLEEQLNPERWVGVTERDNGKRVLIPSEKPSMIMIALNESTKENQGSTWVSTINPAVPGGSFLTEYPGDPSTMVRVWMFMVPEKNITVFSARHIREDLPASPPDREFKVWLSPLVWNPPENVDVSSKWVGYGTSLALDKNTDRMHISYLDYSGTSWGAGKLIYRSGIGSKWDAPVVVDDATGWTTTEGKELARYTSIALGPDGSPHISYMDWKDGHLKYARLLTPGDPGYSNKTPAFWKMTVDDTSSYAGWGSSIAVDKEGNPHISYLRQAGFSDYPQLKYAHGNKTGWNIQTLGTVAGQQDGGDQKWWIENVRDGALTSIALDSSDRPHITYVDYNHAPKKEKTCYSIPKSHGQPDVSCKLNLQLMYTSWNGNEWTTEPVDDTVYKNNELALIPPIYTWHGLYSSLAIDGTNHPHISYFSSWNRVCANGIIPIGGSVFCDGQWIGNLKYATNDGSGWKTELVDETTNSVGLYSSIKVDQNYQPHISYMDWKNGYLRYATRSGKAGWLKKIPDSQNSDTGRFSSLAIDSRGLPRIVYMDYKNGHVKYVYGSFPAEEKTFAAIAHGSEASINAVSYDLSATTADGQEQIQLLSFP